MMLFILHHQLPKAARPSTIISKEKTNAKDEQAFIAEIAWKK